MDSAKPFLTKADIKTATDSLITKVTENPGNFDFTSLKPNGLGDWAVKSLDSRQLKDVAPDLEPEQKDADGATHIRNWRKAVSQDLAGPSGKRWQDVRTAVSSKLSDGDRQVLDHITTEVTENGKLPTSADLVVKGLQTPAWHDSVVGKRLPQAVAHALDVRLIVERGGPDHTSRYGSENNPEVRVRNQDGQFGALGGPTRREMVRGFEAALSDLDADQVRDIVVDLATNQRDSDINDPAARFERMRQALVQGNSDVLTNDLNKDFLDGAKRILRLKQAVAYPGGPNEFTKALRDRRNDVTTRIGDLKAEGNTLAKRFLGEDQDTRDQREQLITSLEQMQEELTSRILLLAADKRTLDNLYLLDQHVDGPDADNLSRLRPNQLKSLDTHLNQQVDAATKAGFDTTHLKTLQQRVQDEPTVRQLVNNIPVTGTQHFENLAEQTADNLESLREDQKNVALDTGLWSFLNHLDTKENADYRAQLDREISQTEDHLSDLQRKIDLIKNPDYGTRISRSARIFKNMQHLETLTTEGKAKAAAEKAALAANRNPDPQSTPDIKPVDGPTPDPKSTTDTDQNQNADEDSTQDQDQNPDNNPDPTPADLGPDLEREVFESSLYGMDRSGLSALHTLHLDDPMRLPEVQKILKYDKIALSEGGLDGHLKNLQTSIDDVTKDLQGLKNVKDQLPNSLKTDSMIRDQAERNQQREFLNRRLDRLNQQVEQLNQNRAAVLTVYGLHVGNDPKSWGWRQVGDQDLPGIANHVAQQITAGQLGGNPTEHLDNLLETVTNMMVNGRPPAPFSPSDAPPKPHGDSNQPNPGQSPKDLPGPKDWGNRRDTAPSSRLVLERFDPKKAIAQQFSGNRDGLKDGQLEGAVMHIRYDVRRFETSPGNWVRELTVPLDLTSSTNSVSTDARNQLAQDLQNHLDNTVNQHYHLPNGDQLHVTVDARANDNVDLDDDSWTADPSRGVPVNVHDSTVDSKQDKKTPRTNQTNWDVNDNSAGLTHEIMHFIGLGEGYKNNTLLFNRTDQPGVMGRNAWSDSSLTDDNLAKIEDISNQAVMHDHHLDSPDAKPNRPYQPPQHTGESAKDKPNLHTPAEAPNPNQSDEDTDDHVVPGSFDTRPNTPNDNPRPLQQHQPNTDNVGLVESVLRSSAFQHAPVGNGAPFVSKTDVKSTVDDVIANVRANPGNFDFEGLNPDGLSLWAAQHLDTDQLAKIAPDLAPTDPNLTGDAHTDQWRGNLADKLAEPSAKHWQVTRAAIDPDGLTHGDRDLLDHLTNQVTETATLPTSADLVTQGLENQSWHDSHVGSHLPDTIAHALGVHLVVDSGGTRTDHGPASGPRVEIGSQNGRYSALGEPTRKDLRDGFNAVLEGMNVDQLTDVAADVSGRQDPALFAGAQRMLRLKHAVAHPGGPDALIRELTDKRNGFDQQLKTAKGQRSWTPQRFQSPREQAAQQRLNADITAYQTLSTDYTERIEALTDDQRALEVLNLLDNHVAGENADGLEHLSADTLDRLDNHLTRKIDAAEKAGFDASALKSLHTRVQQEPDMREAVRQVRRGGLDSFADEVRKAEEDLDAFRQANSTWNSAGRQLRSFFGSTEASQEIADLAKNIRLSEDLVARYQRNLKLATHPDYSGRVEKAADVHTRYQDWKKSNEERQTRVERIKQIDDELAQMRRNARNRELGFPASLYGRNPEQLTELVSAQTDPKQIDQLERMIDVTSQARMGVGIDEHLQDLRTEVDQWTRDLQGNPSPEMRNLLQGFLDDAQSRLAQAQDLRLEALTVHALGLPPDLTSNEWNAFHPDDLQAIEDHVGDLILNARAGGYPTEHLDSLWENVNNVRTGNTGDVTPEPDPNQDTDTHQDTQPEPHAQPENQPTPPPPARSLEHDPETQPFMRPGPSALTQQQDSTTAADRDLRVPGGFDPVVEGSVKSFEASLYGMDRAGLAELSAKYSNDPDRLPLIRRMDDFARITRSPGGFQRRLADVEQMLDDARRNREALTSKSDLLPKALKFASARRDQDNREAEARRLDQEAQHHRDRADQLRRDRVAVLTVNALSLPADPSARGWASFTPQDLADVEQHVETQIRDAQAGGHPTEHLQRFLDFSRDLRGAPSPQNEPSTSAPRRDPVNRPFIQPGTAVHDRAAEHVPGRDVDLPGNLADTDTDGALDAFEASLYGINSDGLRNLKSVYSDDPGRSAVIDKLIDLSRPGDYDVRVQAARDGLATTRNATRRTQLENRLATLEQNRTAALTAKALTLPADPSARGWRSISNADLRAIDHHVEQQIENASRGGYPIDHLRNFQDFTRHALDSRHTPTDAPPKPHSDNNRPNPGQSPKDLPGPKNWGNRRDTAPSSRLVAERFDPKKAIAQQFSGDGLKHGQLQGTATHVRYDVRRFETSPGTWVREFTVPLDLTSSSNSVSIDQRNQLAQDLQNHLDNTVNQHYRLPNGDQLHVRVDARANDTVDANDDNWTSDPSRSVPVNVHDTTVDSKRDHKAPRTNQTNWDVNDNPTGLTHEVMHFLGLGEGYRNDTLLFNRTDQPGVMGRDAWSDTSLTDDNLAKIEDLSNQAVIHDHHLGDPDAKPNRPYQPPQQTGESAKDKPNLHTPTEAPTITVDINGKPLPVQHGTVIPRDVLRPAQGTMLGTHGIEGVYVGGHEGPDNFRSAVIASISQDAPREHQRITTNLRANTDTDLDAIARAANLRVHVLEQNGTWTSHGPETGRPVHIAKAEVDGKDSYLGTKENVHIGRQNVSYPGPSVVLTKKDLAANTFDREKRKVLNRGEFEIETIRGEQYVRMYTAVLNPAKPGSFKDVHQDDEGNVNVFGGAGKADIFWVGGGRPMRAVQWTSKYETDPNFQPGMQPVLRSFLVPLDTFTKVSREATVEALPDNKLAMNVDQTGDVNQFGLRGEHFTAMRDAALKGSLVTYSANQTYDHSELAGRQEDIADLYSRLGLPPGFQSDALGKDNDPWFGWTTDKGQDRKYFRNDPQDLRALATKLSDLYHTHQELKGGKSWDAYFTPHSDSIPGDKEKPGKDGGKSAPPSTVEQRRQDLNVFLNTRGPSGSVVKQLTDGIGRTLGEKLDRGPDTVALDGIKVRDEVLTAAKNLGGILKDVVNKEFRALHTDPVTKFVSPDAKIETIAKMREVMANEELVAAIAKNTADQLVTTALDSLGANRGVDSFKQKLTTAVENAVKQQFTVTGGKFNDKVEQGFANNEGAKKNYFAGNRADAVAAEVSAALKNADLAQDARDSGLGFDRGTVKQRLSAGVLPDAVSDVTTQHLVGLDQKQLQEVFENGLQDAAAKVRTSMDKDPVLKFTTTAQREALADEAARVLNPDTVKGIEFKPVTQEDVDAFMAKVPDYATQAEIGAAIATDEKRVKVDFNTRENAYDPATKQVDSKTFDNDYGAWSQGATRGHTQFHPAGEFGRHQNIGRGLDTVIGDELAKTDDDHRGAERILDHLVTRLDSRPDGSKPDTHESIVRKFNEVVKAEGKHNRYRTGTKTNPNTFGEHAQMVLNQYLRLTRGEHDADRFVPRETLAKAILFHDMEKENSKNQYGAGQEQHDNEPEHRGAVEQMNRHEGLWNSARDFRIAREMVDADPFGFYFRGKDVSAQQVHDFIENLAKDVGRPGGGPVRAADVKKLFDEFHQYYQADFSSYYADSHFVHNGKVEPFGAKSALSGIKEERKNGPLVTTDGGHRFEYDPDYARKYDELKQLFDDDVRRDQEEQERVVTVADDDPAPDTRSLTDRLPEYAKKGEALGSLVPMNPQGVKQVGDTIKRLVTSLDSRRNPPDPVGIEAITGTLDSAAFESFLGLGRKSMVRVGEKWFEVHVRAELDLDAVPADGIAKQPHATISDVNDQTQATHAEGQNDTIARTVGTSYFALIPPGAYVSVAPMVQLATAAQTHTSTVTGTEQRVVRSAGDVDGADVNVRYSIAVTDQVGGLTGSTVDGKVSLLWSQDLGNLKPDAEAKGDPEPDWAENIELLAPEAVLLDEQALFDKVAKRLHPSVTKFGAPGRQALREFVSGGGIRSVLGTALQGGPVVSNDLLSPHGSHRDAVQLQARPKDVELVGVVPGDSELRFNDSSVNGGATAAASKSGMDLSVTVGGGSYLPGKVGGLVGVSGSVSSKVTETATGGTSVTAKNTVEAKGDIGIYKVKVDVDVVTSAGEVETVEATAYVRMGLPEAKAQGLPVPADTRDKLTDVGKRYEPPYLAAAAAAGHVRTGSFTPAAKVQPQIENALRDRPGMAKFLPRWDKFQADDKSSSRDIAERFANLRKLTATFSPAALKAKMDTLLGPGVSVQLKRRGLFTDEYLSVTVKAKLSPGRHLGQATGRSVKGSVATAPSLSSATTVDKSWSVGLEGRMVIPQPTSIATSSISPAVVPIQYSDAYSWKNSGGPTVTTTTSLSGSPDSQVFEHDVEFEVEITSYTRNRPWVKRLTPGSPFRVTPKVSTVAKTGDPALPKISGKVDLWVNDGSALKKDPGDFLPGKPGTTVLNKNDTPTIEDMLAGPKPDQPKFLHVEAFTNTEALRDEALRQLERASDGDGVLGLSGGEARKRVDRMFSPETFRGGLPKFLRQGARAGGFRYERRVADRVGGLGMNVALSNPKVVVASDAGGSETTFAGGAKAAFEQTHKQALEGNVQLGVTIRPDGSMATAHGQGQVYASAKWSPWTRTSGGSTEVSASVDHLNRANAKGRTVLVQYDADVRLVAETRQESLVNGSTSRAGADVKLPGAVYVRMSEDQAREQGLLPKVEPRTEPPGKMAPPALVGRDSSALGAAVVEDAPDLSQLVRDARTALGRTGDKLLPKSVLDDSMTNLQRTLDLASPDAVTSLVDSALDGGAPLLLHDAGVLSTDTYQVLLKATITDTEFLDVVHDGGEIDHVVSAAVTDKENAGHGSSYGGQFRGAGRGLFSDTKPDVSGYEGLTLGVSGSKTKTDQTVSATATTKGSKASQSGPAVRYRHQVKFELVVQRGGKTYPVTEQNVNVTVRSAADDHKISTEGQTPEAHEPRTTELTAADTTPERLAEWQAQGVGKLPPSAHTEGVRGSAAVQAGAERALRLAGAGNGLTSRGTGANNTLVTSLTNEILQGHLPSMLDGPLAAPDLHEASLIKNGHGSVKVYSRLANPDLTALSDTVKLERTDQTTATFTGEAKEALSGENQYMPGVGGVTDPKDNSHSWSGADIRNPAAMSDPTATVAGGQRSTVAKPKGRSGLVGFDVEYRVVADLGGGRTAAVEVKVPASALVRMSDVDVEKLLGEALPDAITKAQDTVKDAASDWRKAEEAVETAQHEADDRWLDERDSVKTLTKDANGLAVETDADPVRELRQALADAENDAKDAGRELREGNAEITRLQDVSEQALALASVTDEGSPERQQLLDQVSRAEQGVRDIRTAQPALVRRRQDAQDRAEQLANVLNSYRKDSSDFTSRREDALRQVREAREKADEARKKWWQAKEEVDWRLATHVWPAKKVESRFDPRSTEHVVEAPDTESDTGPATISGWDVNADRPYDFDVSDVQLHQVTDRSGKVVAVSFLPAVEQTSAVEHDWVADNSGEVSSLDEGVMSKTLDPVVAEARRNGTTPDLGGRQFGDWAAKSPAPWGTDTGDTFFVFAHGKPQSVKLTLVGGQTVRVDGRTFARIVANSAPFAQAGPKSSVTLIACSTGQTDGPGGVARDFQRALSDLGGPATVHAPTKPTLFGRDTATLGKALGSTGAFTTVTDGGHFRTFGGTPGDETIVALVHELDTGLRTEPPAGPISLADHDGTLALASTVERQLADTAARTGELRLTDVHDLVARHERPDVVYSAVLTHLASGNTPVHTVVDVRRDPDTGEWTRVSLPPMARGLITVTGKGTWSTDELARPARLNPAWTEGPARETTHSRPDAAHYAETLAEHHLDGEPLPPVTVPADRVDHFKADVTRLLGERGFGDLAFDHLVHADHTRLTGEVVGEPGVTIDFAPGAVTTTVLTDHTGTARGLTFLESAEAAKVQTWLRQTRGENLVVEADPDEMRAFATGAANDLRGRGPGDGGIPVRTPWADELAEGRTFLVTGHGEETRVKVAVTGPDGTRREVYVDGETLAQIVTASPEFADAQPDSVTLFQCAAARRLGPGGVAHDFQAALETRGGPSIVHAATDSVLANHRDDSPDDEPSAPLFGARDDAFTAVVRGGHWETLGRPLDADAVVDELTNALLKNWRYARVPATGGPVRLADRARTLYLAAEVVNAVYDRAPDDEVQALLGRHEDPELLAAVVNEYLRATMADSEPDEVPPYTSAAELTRDLRAISANHGPAPDGAPLLGPDLFGLYRAPEPPGFLRGHDYSNLTAGQGLALLDTLDLTQGVPVLRDQADPANLPDLRDWTIEHTRADDRLSAWAPGDVEPLAKTTSTPLLMHAIWLGGPLRDAGTMSAFRENFGGAAARLHDGVVPVLWTDVPRSQIELALTTEPPAEGPDPLADVRDFVNWAQQHHVRLVNVDEVFSSENPMLLNEFYHSETGKLTGPGYAAASDILRMELMNRFGGLYTDGDNVVESLEDLFHAATSREGYATHRIGMNVANSAFAMSKGHPFARVHLDVVRENYGKTQRNLLPPEAYDLPPAFFQMPQGRVHRNSIIVRTGPSALSGTARRIGLPSAFDLPEMTDIRMNSDGSWLKPPAAGTRPVSGRDETLELTQHVVQSLVRGLYNRAGDLHLTAVEPAVHRHADPDLVWDAALAFLAADPDLAPLVRTVTDQHTYTGTDHDVRLPASARALLDIDPDRVHRTLGEVQHGATLRNPDDAVLVSDMDTPVETGARELARALRAVEGELPAIHVTGGDRAQAREAARELAGHLGRELGDRDLLARVPVKIRVAEGSGVTVSFRPVRGGAVEFSLDSPAAPAVFGGVDGQPYSSDSAPFGGYRGAKPGVVTKIDTTPEGSAELMQSSDRPPTLVLVSGALADEFTQHVRSSGMDLPVHATPTPSPDNVVDTFPAVSYLVSGDHALTEDDRRTIAELGQAAEHGWWYRPSIPAGPVSLDDRTGTLALLSGAVSALRSGGMALDLTAAADVVARHEQPDLLWTAALELASHNVDVPHVIDHRLVDGRWQQVRLPESARERFTVTGKGVWRDGSVSRPVRLNTEPGPASDFDFEPVSLPLDESVARWIAESTVERTADGLPAPRVQVSGPDDVRAQFVAQVQALLAELTPAGATPHAAASIVTTGSGTEAMATISLPANAAPSTLSAAETAVAVGLAEEYTLLQLHGVADTLLAKPGRAAEALLDLANEVAHGTDVGRAADAVEVLDRHGSLDAALDNGLLLGQFRKILGHADAESYARDLATAIRSFASEKLAPDVLKEAVRGALEGWRGGPGTFEQRVERTRDTLWVMRRLHLSSLAWLNRWRTAEHIRQYAARMKEQAAKQDAMLAKVSESEDAFLASVGEPHANRGGAGDGE
ncbi:TcdA/TcdB catalytic glycosyltransferase domain-containing protein [Amycolatopsis sp. DSM 110486]|uniref:TcdA/TcdB catalytic glycosyltransferase domain-containing protein n=1 Tax=Amycolatopsis sp. DSM 110486 TaxID=2865832 RepID=UPI001C696CB3|nr:TcdA/TcdB catalytic glycosyltransferase domain-containing protein [Amycolatopsis sp. DSM 110486]QYN23794.1 hypothetical protein K1T34_15890 [Amycolatopsis sp. DSM 110486]